MTEAKQPTPMMEKETPSERLANLFKQIVRENDHRDREKAKRETLRAPIGTNQGKPARDGR